MAIVNNTLGFMGAEFAKHPDNEYLMAYKIGFDQWLCSDRLVRTSEQMAEDGWEPQVLSVTPDNVELYLEQLWDGAEVALECHPGDKLIYRYRGRTDSYKVIDATESTPLTHARILKHGPVSGNAERIKSYLDKCWPNGVNNADNGMVALALSKNGMKVEEGA